MDIVAAIVDCLILAWLVGTWFYEGHHKKCKVTVVCAHCGNTTEENCQASQHKKEE